MDLVCKLEQIFDEILHYLMCIIGSGEGYNFIKVLIFRITLIGVSELVFIKLCRFAVHNLIWKNFLL